MVFPIGIEPTTCCLGGSRSILLSYENKKKINCFTSICYHPYNKKPKNYLRYVNINNNKKFAAYVSLVLVLNPISTIATTSSTKLTTQLSIYLGNFAVTGNICDTIISCSTSFKSKYSLAFSKAYLG